MQHKDNAYATFITRQFRSILVLSACLIVFMMFAAMTGKATNSATADRHVSYSTGAIAAGSAAHASVKTAAVDPTPSPTPTPSPCGIQDDGSGTACQPTDDPNGNLFGLPFGVPKG